MAAPSGGGSRKAMLLRLDPAVHDALQRWAKDELRSANAQAELALRRALQAAGRLPRGVPVAGPPEEPAPEPCAEEELGDRRGT